jgi:hypothetical protein
MATRFSIPTLLGATLLTAACASGGATPATQAPPPQTTPAATDARTDLLAPSDAALRAAERAELNGLELGKMWTFQDPPVEWWEEQYGFTPSDEWLEKVQTASLRFGGFCSASFVSPDGLILTNHHCARGCIEDLSTAEADYLEDGFYAPTRDAEQSCPELYVDQLTGVEDVTDQVLAAGRDVETDTARARAQTERAAEIEEACEEETGLTCQVVSLWHGGRFHLYRYQRYEPIKLVFAPEHQAASFGGDYDNFTYPRYALDIAFLRAYEENGDPIRPEAWFAWDEDGAQDGEPVFIVGNPGSTSRLYAVSQIMYEKYRRHPYIVQYLTDYVELLRWIGSMGPDAERSVREQLASFENSLKAYSGQLEGLQDTLLVGRKIHWEADLREAVRSDPELRTEFGGVWDEMAAIQAAKVPVAQRMSIYNIGFIGDPQLALGGQLIRYIRESAKPADERGEDYGAEELAEMEQQLLGPSPVNPEIAIRFLAIRLRLARNYLPADDPFVQAAFRAGETPMDAARRIAGTTRIMDPEFRRTLIEGGAGAVQAESDIGIRLARIMEDSFQELSARMDELTAREAVQEERLANALFAVKGTRIPPDATMTLRITDGIVTGYPYNGTLAPPRTAFAGIFERAFNFDYEEPFQLPERYIEAEDRIDMLTPLNFVTTDDITGGNSGSPMLSRDAEIVGAAFDGNIESLPNEWLYDETVARTVGVHSAGILEALRNIYQAEALVEELVGQ